MRREDREVLINRYLDGHVSAAEAAELSQELETSEDARDCYWKLASLHAALATDETPLAASPPAPPTIPVFRRLGVRPLVIAASLTGLALIIAVTMAWLRSPGPLDNATPVAHFGPMQEGRWVGRDINVQPGDAILAGQRLELSSGSVAVHFATGARVTLLGPCIFEVTSATGGFLTLGQLRVVCATPESKGFTVLTRTARLIDVGTEFVAAASADGQTRVDVTSGEVHVHLDGLMSPHRIRTGEALSVEAGRTQVLVRIESGDGTAAFRFPSIEPPSRFDTADLSQGRASIRVLNGALHLTAPIPSGPADLLLNGRGQSVPDSPAESVFFDNNAPGGLLLDLGRAITVSKINTYSWHEARDGENRVRAVQKFTLYGYAGDHPPLLDGSPDRNWEPLARVNSDDFFHVMQPIDRPAQQACSITGAAGPIGRYRYLLWEVHPTQSRDPLFLNNTFYSEFDVYGEP